MSPYDIYGEPAKEPQGTKSSSLPFPVRHACWLAAIDWPREFDGRVASTLTDTGVSVLRINVGSHMSPMPDGHT